MTVNTEIENNSYVESKDSKTTEQVNDAQDSSETKSEQTAQDIEAQRRRTAMGQIKSYQSQIDEGEITKEEAPQWMQNDLREKPAENSPEDLKAKLKAEVLDDLEFEKLQGQLPSDLSEEQTELINKTIQSEMKLGKTKSEALEYATFKAGIKVQKTDNRDTHLDLTSFPMIKPRQPKPKKEEIVKTDSDKAFVEALRSKYGIEIKN
jgi:hypothetical protein